MRNSILKILLFLALIASNLILPAFVLAQTCPDLTTVTGTTVNFVGELTDMGGDSVTYVWFEYGKTMSLGQKTSEKALTQTGKYCILISGLESSTTYYYRAAARNSAGTSYGEIKSFTTTSESSVDIKANNSDGPITIPYNSSVTLSWTSSNVSSCTASGAWSGSKPLSGFESTGNLTFSKTYTLNCTGPRGSASDSVTVNVSSAKNLIVNKFVRNLSDGTDWLKSVSADPGEVISFSIRILAESSLQNVIVKDILPEKIKFRGNLKIDGSPLAGNIALGINIGNLSPNQTKTITFDADILGPESFPFGESQLTNRAYVSVGDTSILDEAKIFVTKKAVAGAATEIPTGLTNNLFLDSIFLPLLIAGVIIWLFKSHILSWEEWLDERKRKYREYKAKKLLQLRIAQIKAREFLKR